MGWFFTWQPWIFSLDTRMGQGSHLFEPSPMRTRWILSYKPRSSKSDGCLVILMVRKKVQIILMDFDGLFTVFHFCRSALKLETWQRTSSSAPTILATEKLLAVVLLLHSKASKIVDEHFWSMCRDEANTTLPHFVSVELFLSAQSWDFRTKWAGVFRSPLRRISTFSSHAAFASLHC